MRRIIATFLLLFIYTVVFSQKPTLSSDFSLEISERYTKIKAPSNYNFAFNKHILLLKKGKDDLTLQRFSIDGLKKSKQKSQVIDDKGKFVSIVQMKDKVFYFYSVGNKLYAQTISIISNVIGKPRRVVTASSAIADDFDFRSTFGFDAGGRVHKFAVKKSFEGDKILVQYRIQPGLLSGKNFTETVVVNVFDAVLEPLWRQHLTMPYEALRMDKVDFAIDHTGSHYMLVKVFDEVLKNDREAVKDDGSFHVELLKTTFNTGTVVQHPLEIDQKVINTMVLFPDKTKNMSVFGFYKDSLNAVKASGFFKAALAEDGRIAKKTSYSIPKAIAAKYDAERTTRITEGYQEKDDKYDLEDLKINSIVAEADNSFTIFSEQRYVTEKYMTTATGIKPKYTYHYRDVFAFNILEDATFKWFHKLPKHQVGTYGKRAMSFTYMKGGGNYYVVFLDDFKNLRLALDGFAYKLFDGKGGYLYVMAYVINQEKGLVDKVAVINTKDIKGYKMSRFGMDKIIRLSDTNLIIEASDPKKKNFLLKLSVKK